MKTKLLTLFIVVFAFLFSCNKGEVYYQFHQIRNGDWSKGATLDFVLDSLSVQSGKCDILLEIVNNNQYPYRNLWLFVQQNITDTVFTTDSIEIKLAYLHGKWLGSGTAGLYQLSVPYKTSVAIDPSRAYLVRIRQGMTDHNLKGIEKVGVKVVAQSAVIRAEEILKRQPTD